MTSIVGKVVGLAVAFTIGWAFGEGLTFSAWLKLFATVLIAIADAFMFGALAQFAYAQIVERLRRNASALPTAKVVRR